MLRTQRWPRCRSLSGWNETLWAVRVSSKIIIAIPNNAGYVFELKKPWWYHLKTAKAELQFWGGAWDKAPAAALQSFLWDHPRVRCSCCWQIGPQRCLLGRQTSHLYTNSSQYCEAVSGKSRIICRGFLKICPRKSLMISGEGQACSYPYHCHGYWRESGCPSEMCGAGKRLRTTNLGYLQVVWSRKGTESLDLVLWNRY